MRNQVDPVLDGPVRTRTRDDDGHEGAMTASAAVTLKFAVAVVPPCSSCLMIE